jgi:hypothetical protein
MCAEGDAQASRHIVSVVEHVDETLAAHSLGVLESALDSA